PEQGGGDRRVQGPHGSQHHTRAARALLERPTTLRPCRRVPPKLLTRFSRAGPNLPVAPVHPSLRGPRVCRASSETTFSGIRIEFDTLVCGSSPRSVIL